MCHSCYDCCFSLHCKLSNCRCITASDRLLSALFETLVMYAGVHISYVCLLAQFQNTKTMLSLQIRSVKNSGQATGERSISHSGIGSLWWSTHKHTFWWGKAESRNCWSPGSKSKGTLYAIIQTDSCGLQLTALVVHSKLRIRIAWGVLLQIDFSHRANLNFKTTRKGRQLSEISLSMVKPSMQLNTIQHFPTRNSPCWSR